MESLVLCTPKYLSPSAAVMQVQPYYITFSLGCVKAHSRLHAILPSASQMLLENVGIISCSHSADVRLENPVIVRCHLRAVSF